jgi:hypothetical protein
MNLLSILSFALCAVLLLLCTMPVWSPRGKFCRLLRCVIQSALKGGVVGVLCALLAWPIAGCSGITVAQDIVNWTPALQSAVQVVDSTASVLDPASAALFTQITNGFDAGSTLVANQAQAYLANPSAGVLAQLQAQVLAFQEQVSTSLLSAAKIENPTSQAKATADINAVATAINAIFGLVLSISSKSAQVQLTALAGAKIAAIEPYLEDKQSVRMIAGHYHEPEFVAAWQVHRGVAAMTQAGI